MNDYRHGSHTLYDVKLHIVWITKYRYPVLTGKIGMCQVPIFLHSLSRYFCLNLIGDVLSFV